MQRFATLAFGSLALAALAVGCVEPVMRDAGVDSSLQCVELGGPCGAASCCTGSCCRSGPPSLEPDGLRCYASEEDAPGPCE